MIKIDELISEHLDIPISDILGRRTLHHIVRARQLAMYLRRVINGESYPSIARHYGKRDHTVVMYAMKRVEQRMSEDVTFRKMVNTMILGLTKQRVQVPALRRTRPPAATNGWEFDSRDDEAI